jgi:very-short-patch-repair endonuclease
MTKWSTIKRFARELRRNPTPAERKLWELVRRRQLKGQKFLRQQPIIYNQRSGERYFFITDFYCAEQKLVIELDGRVHHHQKEYGQQRDRVLAGLGLRPLRIRNEELQDREQVSRRMLERLE